jgi:nicotinamide mononucleotide (NMN) deamidase PncC
MLTLVEDEVAARAGKVVKAIEARMSELAISWSELAKAAGVNYETVRRFRRGADVSLPTKRALAAALGWGPDAFSRISRGEAPVVAKLPEGTAMKSTLDISDLPLADQAMVTAMVERLRQARGQT